MLQTTRARPPVFKIKSPNYHSLSILVDHPTGRIYRSCYSWLTLVVDAKLTGTNYDTVDDNVDQCNSDRSQRPLRQRCGACPRKGT